MERHEFFVTCAPGVEPVLFQEMKVLKFPKVECQVGGVYFKGTMEHAWLANLQLRTAIRVLRRLARFEVMDADDLYSGVRKVDWSPFLAGDGTFFVDAQTRESALDHSQFIAQRTKDGIADNFRKRERRRPSVAKERADLRVHVHVWRDRCTLAVDTSGDSLHKRGWRTYQGLAPMSETLAAAVLLLSQWDRKSPLIDPFCGSGTLLVEAALLARNIAPGLFRSFGFQNWPEHRPYPYASFRKKIQDLGDLNKKLFLFGRDLEKKHITGAEANAESAGLGDLFQLSVGDALDFPFKKGWGAWVVSNLPYGHRVGEDKDLEKLHRDVGSKLRQEAAGYHLALLTGERRFAHAMGFHDWQEHTLRNGSLQCSLLTLDL